MPDFKNMIKGMEEKEKPEAPTQEETEKAGKLADSGFKIGEHRFIGKDNNKANPGFIAYGGNSPDQKLSTKELAKVYDEQQKAKNIDPEQDRLAKLKKDAIAESQATAKKEAPLAQNPGESGNPKEILSQMEGIRSEEKKKESDLLRKWAVDKSISYDEFKNEEKKLHQEAQDRVDSLYGTLTTALNKTPSADKPKKASWEDPNKRVKEADAKYKPIYDEMEKEDDEIYRAYWYETDPKKKAELKAQLEEHGKKIDALIEEWEQATGFGKKEAPLVEKPAQNLLMGLTPEQRQAHYEKIFKENDANDEIFGGKGRAYGDLTDLYNGYDIPKGQPFDENLTDEHNKKMLEEFDDYVQQRGWYPEKGKEKYPDKARRGEEDIMAEYRDIKQDDIPEAIRQLEEKKKTAKTDEEWERYDEQARLLRRDWEENYGREPEPRLLKPTDEFTDAEIKNFLDYLFYTNIDQGYTYEKTPQGDYYTNLVAGDPEAEPVVVNKEQLKGFLRNSLQNVDNLAQNLYEWQIDNQ